jgi:uncharacterized protein (DUF58 family)
VPEVGRQIDRVATDDHGRGASGKVAELLPPDRMLQLERLSRRSQKRLLGTLTGRHQSVHRGSSLDFADHRRYFPGDDVRHIDYHVLARFDQLMVRQFDAEEQNTVRLVVDTSASMAVGGKFRHAAELAAALGFVALNGGDVVCLHTTTSPEARVFSGALGLASLLETLAVLPLGGSTSLQPTLNVAASRQGPPGTTVVLSDMFTDEWESALRQLLHPRRRSLVLQVLHPDEITPTLRGDLELIDSESKQRQPVSIDQASVAEHTQRALDWISSVKTVSTSLRIQHEVSMVGSDATDLIVDALDRSGPGSGTGSIQ